MEQLSLQRAYRWPRKHDGQFAFGRMVGVGAGPATFDQSLGVIDAARLYKPARFHRN
jgi:hypothetical protein